MGRKPLNEDPDPAARRRRIVEELELKRHARRLENLRGGFDEAIAGLDSARTANEEHYRRRLKAAAPKAPEAKKAGKGPRGGKH